MVGSLQRFAVVDVAIELQCSSHPTRTIHVNIVTLGPAGTYSHRAALTVADDVSFRDSIPGLVTGVANGTHERAVVPIENSIEGSVRESLDALADEDVAVTTEIVAPIRHALLGQGPEVSTIASHAQAVGQCRDFLQSAYPEASVRTVSSTARGVELATEDSSVGAIAHPSNADDRPLSVLDRDVQTRSSNETRFFVLAPDSDRSRRGSKSSVIVYPDRDYPGFMLELLEPFAERNINLSRVDARPSGKRLGDYLIHLDIEAGYDETRTEAAITEAKTTVENGWVRWLGSYDIERVPN